MARPAVARCTPAIVAHSKKKGPYLKESTERLPQQAGVHLRPRAVVGLLACEHAGGDAQNSSGEPSHPQRTGSPSRLIKRNATS